LVKDEKKRKYEEDKKAREEARAKRLANQEAKDKELEDEENSKPKINPYLPLVGTSFL
jgi:hypothetical protein